MKKGTYWKMFIIIFAATFLQAIVQLIVVGEAFNFGSYSGSAWTFQIFYWLTCLYWAYAIIKEDIVAAIKQKSSEKEKKDEI